MLIHELRDISPFLFVPYLVLDVETDGIDPLNPQCSLSLVGIGSPTQIAVVPLSHPEGKGNRDKNVDSLRQIFAQHVPVIGLGTRYDVMWLESCGIPVRGTFYDLKLVEYLLTNTPDGRGQGLRWMIEKYIGNNEHRYKDMVHSLYKAGFTSNQIPLSILASYNEKDVMYTHQLWKLLYPRIQLEGCEKIFALCSCIDRILMNIQRQGIYIHEKTRKKLEKEYLHKLETHHRALVSCAPKGYTDINFNSPQQLSHVLYTVCQLPRPRTAKTSTATDIHTLEELMSHSQQWRPFLQALIEYSHVEKEYTTYLSNYPQFMDHHSCIHPVYSLRGTRTGRLSCRSPNVANIPRMTTAPIRTMFRSKFDKGQLVSLDLNQIELKVAAWLANDHQLKSDIREGRDIHMDAVEVLYGERRDDKRQASKNGNFAMIYGCTLWKLSQTLGVSEQKAQTVWSWFRTRYPSVFVFQNAVISEILETKRVTTPVGRFRSFEHLDFNDPRQKAQAIREGVNSVIQSFAHDILLMIMKKLDNTLCGMQSHIIIENHDEIVCDVHPKEVNDVKDIFRRNLCGTDLFEYFGIDFDVPLSYTQKCGSDWGHMVPFV